MMKFEIEVKLCGKWIRLKDPGGKHYGFKTEAEALTMGRICCPALAKAAGEPMIKAVPIEKEPA